MDQPPSFEISQTPPLVCTIHKAFLWTLTSPNSLVSQAYNGSVSFGFTSNKCDQSFFV